jgi:hypothetical protein
MTGGSIRTITNTRHDTLARETTTDTIVNTTRLAPVALIQW